MKAAVFLMFLLATIFLTSFLIQMKAPDISNVRGILDLSTNVR